MSRKPWILGISASNHNGAACLLHGDEIIVAIQEERISRLKYDIIHLDQHILCLKYCLDEAGITPDDLDLIVVSQLSSPFDTRNNPIARNPLLKEHDIDTIFIPHHLGHAASAFGRSGFTDSLVLVIDGCGSFTHELQDQELNIAKVTVYNEDSNFVKTIKSHSGYSSELRLNYPSYAEHLSVYHFSPDAITSLEKYLIEPHYALTYNKSVHMPEFRTLGHMFNSAAYQIFGNYFESGKVMGLAAFGKETIDKNSLVCFNNDNLYFRTDVLELFRDCYAERWPLHNDRYANLATSVQNALETTLLDIVDSIHNTYPHSNLCYSGGVALNSVANERIICETPFSDVSIIPASDDAGPALGAAYFGLWQLENKNTSKKVHTDSFGKKYKDSETLQSIRNLPNLKTIDQDEIIDITTRLLTEGNIVGWFQEGAEFGPRALGFRSILCDPRLQDGKNIVNNKVKFRESFRPFAPAILKEELDNWFVNVNYNLTMDFMLRVSPIKEEKQLLIPSVVHKDGTGRLQSVSRKNNKCFYELISSFFDKTGVPILLNTSFNVMREPIVENPFDALLCLLTTGLDYCIINNVLVTKTDHNWSILATSPVIIAQVVLEQTDFVFPNSNSYRAYLINTPYGPKVHTIDWQMARVLDYFDGNTTGFDILDRLPMNLKDIDEFKLKSIFCRLLSLSIIKIPEKPGN